MGKVRMRHELECRAVAVFVGMMYTESDHRSIKSAPGASLLSGADTVGHPQVCIGVTLTG